VTELICRRVVFHSPTDERTFFSWVNQIRCVARVEGRGDVIVLHVSKKRISEANLRELLALFRRYRVAMPQLAQFENVTNRGWFRDPQTFWFRAVFQT
jgi:hypothetical protein